ncbi:DUF4355 domain-containing protein [Clostridium botulinum]|uniref:capsid assembly scaffolding protein Gp46 family protein n=1 Tax=Clostridium botulinum TaxID=1491 RepID=UPI0007735F65|nr:DUF4355 domain-containing protein [Clostridium botulinum]NFH81729.1 DUF4355 domain-containing protein [Clostridium botulinum]NFH84960.1 DUF4355 domain-containing protein [Clostridium botulinum]NFI12968.1 DUF4355 domain-containing protein [Clostridium botulinum]NFI16166.1 DUF4355 domain-containing protein [Clostridium botulinum]NFO85969.1 DUF4355 domain-containing protein [Clostridium botulinum]
MEITEVQEFINNNAESEEVKGLIKSFQQPLNRDTVELWCKDGEGKSWLDRNCDLYSNKAVETARTNALEKFKQEELPKLQEEYYKSKTGEGMTEGQKQMKALQDKIEKMESEKAENERIKANADKLKEKGLNTDLARFINSDDDIQFFETLITNSVDSKVKEKLGDGAYKPPTGGASDSITQEKFDKMSYNEKVALFNSNRALYDKFTGKNN